MDCGQVLVCPFSLLPFSQMSLLHVTERAPLGVHLTVCM